MAGFGYACKTIGVPGTVVRSLILRSATRERLTAICRDNIRAVASMARFASVAGLSCLRISSDVIPLATHPDVCFDWRAELDQDLAACGGIIRASGIRVSMHPGQYTVLNSPDADVARRASEDLAYHADFLDALATDRSARIVLHVGGVYGDAANALDRFRQRFDQLPDNVARRLALENDDRSFAVDVVSALAKRLGLPVIFDIFHHRVNPAPEGDALFWLNQTAATWKAGDGRQKIHYSLQQPGARPGSHSRTIPSTAFLQDLWPLVRNRDCDVMLEVKDKNLSAVKCRNLALPGGSRSDLTREWARYKYAVLEKDPEAYGRIRQLLKEVHPSAEAFYSLVEDALALDTVPGRARNAAEHVWGHVAANCDTRRKKLVEKDIVRLGSGLAVLPALKRKLHALAEEQGEAYLLESLYFVDLPPGP